MPPTLPIPFWHLLLQVLAAGAAQAIILGILGYFGRSFVERWLSRDTARFKDELDRKSQESLAAYEHKLALARERASWSFQQLQGRRLDALITLDAAIASFRTTVNSWLNNPEWMPPIEDVAAALNDVNKVFESCRLLLPEELDVAVSTQMSSLVDTVRELLDNKARTEAETDSGPERSAKLRAIALSAQAAVELFRHELLKASRRLVAGDLA